MLDSEERRCGSVMVWRGRYGTPLKVKGLVDKASRRQRLILPLIPDLPLANRSAT